MKLKKILSGIGYGILTLVVVAALAVAISGGIGLLLYGFRYLFGI